MIKEEFLKDVQGWDNHRHLLWEALEDSDGDVIEMGMGQGSTPFLHDYCEYHKPRKLFSYENNQEYIKQFKDYETVNHRVKFVTDWDIVSINHPAPSVVLIDHAPGERRYIDVQRFANTAKFIVIHDSEPEATGYMMDKIWHLFKFRKDFKSEGAWASMVSNFVKL